MKDKDSLKPIELHLLLALAAEPAHGYALVQRIEVDSEGRVSLLPGNLYAVIRRLEVNGLVRESDREPEPNEDRRRRYYELTPSGRSVLLSEAEHLEILLGHLRSRLTEPVLEERDA